MTTLGVCTSCRRHVKTHEPTCPFCGSRAPLAKSGFAASFTGRMSRSTFAALSSLLAASCSSDPSSATGPIDIDDGALDTTRTETTAPIDSASDSFDSFAATDSSDANADDSNAAYDSSSPSDSGTGRETLCASDVGVSDVAYSGTAVAVAYDCNGYACECFDGGGEIICQPPSATSGGSDPKCMACVTCDLVAYLASCRCTPTPDGCGIASIGCWGCYGAPPPRRDLVA